MQQGLSCLETSRGPVDSRLLMRARRLAKRSRAETACLSCKMKKIRCDDRRPCSRCLVSKISICRDAGSNQSDKDSIKMNGKLQKIHQASSLTSNGELQPRFWGREGSDEGMFSNSRRNANSTANCTSNLSKAESFSFDASAQPTSVQVFHCL
jgi:hypothetical protein